MRILAIETSCDETAVAVLQISGKFNFAKVKILSNIVASQVKIHAKWGGVVPNLAKREHQRNLPIIFKKALKESKLLKFSISNFQFSKFIPKIDLIAVTSGPGLEPALWVGINFAEDLAKRWKKPLIGINHLEGHIFSVFLKKNREISNLKSQISKIFPAIALLVSGGHTELVLMENWLKYKVIGQTLDDAAGEAFDKVARLLGLGYPGGPVIAKAAEKAGKTGTSIKLPRPMFNSKDYNFSFSGLKTAVLYLLRDLKRDLKFIQPYFHDRRNVVGEICREFQQAVIDVLLKKTMRAAKEYKAKTIILGGGVAANKELRRQLEKAIEEINFGNRRCGRAPERSEGRDKRFSKFDFRNKRILLMPEMKFTGDNAAMIALAAYFRANKKKTPHTAGQIVADSGSKL